MVHSMKVMMVVTFLSLFALGCASPEVTSKEYSEPRETLAAAQQAQVSSDSQANIYIQYAKENLQVADELIKEKKNDRARFYLDRAQADAKLALAYARRDTTRSELKKIETKINDLRSESI